MSQLSFICFCVEHYADHVHRSSNEVYQLFKQEGLLDLLRSDYEDLHGMGLEYMMQFCGEYLNGQSAFETYLPDGHATVRAMILPDIIHLLMKNYGWTEEEALNRFYLSATGASFADDDTGLYGQSALYVSGLFAEETQSINASPVLS